MTTDCAFLATVRSGKSTTIQQRTAADTCLWVYELNPAEFATNVLGVMVHTVTNDTSMCITPRAVVAASAYGLTPVMMMMAVTMSMMLYFTNFQ